MLPPPHADLPPIERLTHSTRFDTTTDGESLPPTTSPDKQEEEDVDGRRVSSTALMPYGYGQGVSFVTTFAEFAQSFFVSASFSHIQLFHLCLILFPSRPSTVLCSSASQLMLLKAPLVCSMRESGHTRRPFLWHRRQTPTPTGRISSWILILTIHAQMMKTTKTVLAQRTKVFSLVRNPPVAPMT